MNLDLTSINWAWVISIGSAIFAGIGLFLNWLAIRGNNKTMQLQLLSDSFKNIKETELTLYKDYKNKGAKIQKEWGSLFFNSVNFFCFLVNEKFIKNKKMIGFFKSTIIAWYEEIFIMMYDKKEINDETLFPEFKKLYNLIKKQKDIKSLKT